MSPRAAEAEPEMTEEKPEEKLEEMPESPEARDGVRRPTPLLLGPLLFGNDTEAPELPISSPTYCMAIPVHRTFIEFNCPEQSPTGYHWAMHTAPASMAHDIRGDLEAEAAQVTYAHWGSYPTADDTIVAGPPGSRARATRAAPRATRGPRPSGTACLRRRRRRLGTCLATR